MIEIEVGKVWKEGSYPVPTVVEIAAVAEGEVTVKHEWRRPVTLSRALFLGQGFSLFKAGRK